MEKRPVFLYGTGNGGDKIVDVCLARNIPLTGVFASDGFVRNRTFRDMPVQSYGDVVKNYGNDIVILLAFGTDRPELYRMLEMLDNRHTLYIPEVPLYGGLLFDRTVLHQYQPQLQELRSLLADEHSRLLLDDAILFRLTGERQYLMRVTNPAGDIRHLFGKLSPKIMLDGGAFRGDSTALYAAALPSLTAIYAAEADVRTYRHLCAYAENSFSTENSLSSENASSIENASSAKRQIFPLHCALWDSDGEMTYASSASRGSGIVGQNHRAKTVTVPTCTIDSIFADRTDTPVDLLKLDVEGAETKAIAGALHTIRLNRPAMAVSLYHRTEDIWELPLYLHTLLPDRQLYLRRPMCIPMWDLTLFMA